MQVTAALNACEHVQSEAHPDAEWPQKQAQSVRKNYVDAIGLDVGRESPEAFNAYCEQLEATGETSTAAESRTLPPQQAPVFDAAPAWRSGLGAAEKHAETAAAAEEAEAAAAADALAGGLREATRKREREAERQREVDKQQREEDKQQREEYANLLEDAKATEAATRVGLGKASADDYCRVADRHVAQGDSCWHTAHRRRTEAYRTLSSGLLLAEAGTLCLGTTFGTPELRCSRQCRPHIRSCYDMACHQPHGSMQPQVDRATLLISRAEVSLASGSRADAIADAEASLAILEAYVAQLPDVAGFMSVPTYFPDGSLARARYSVIPPRRKLLQSVASNPMCADPLNPKGGVLWRARAFVESVRERDPAVSAAPTNPLYYLQWVSRSR